MKLSVIVLSCNNGKYLRQCLDSIVNQTHKDLQIIISDDGSTDDSVDIIKEYVEKDERITAWLHKNMGVGESFNTALGMATGDYIAEVDSDDYLDLYMYEELAKYAEGHDIVKAGYWDSQDLRDNIAVMITNEPIELNLEEMDPMSRMNVFCFQPSLWSAIYRRQFLIDNDIKMLGTEGAAYNDTSFIFKANIMSDKIMLLPECYYHWRTDNMDSSTKHCKPFLVVGEYEEMERYLMERPYKALRYRCMLSRLRYGTYSWAYCATGDMDFFKKMQEDFRHDWEFQDVRLYEFEQWTRMIRITLSEVKNDR